MSASELAKAIGNRVQAASEQRWLAIGVVVTVGTSSLAVQIDGNLLTGLRKVSTVAAGDIVLVGIVRGSTSVQHVVIGKIT